MRVLRKFGIMAVFDVPTICASGFILVGMT